MTSHVALPVDKAILLVEDDPDDAELTIRALRRVGIRGPIITARTAAKAMALLRHPPADLGHDGTLLSLVLLDLNLPGPGGLGVLDAIRSDPQAAQVPIVVVTGSTSPRDRERCDENGALGILEKPVDPGALLQLLGDANVTRAAA